MKAPNRHIQDYLLIIGFLLLLIIPNLVMLFDLENTPNNENKKFSKTPDFNLENPQLYISDFKNYYVNNLGLKLTFTNMYLNFKSQILNDHPLPNEVVQGKEGWYFLGNSYNDILNDSFGNVPFTNAELHAITQKLRKIKQHLNLKKIEFYIVVPPNKQSIYKEHLPFQLTSHTKRLSQLQQHLKTHSDLKIISPETLLMSKKNDLPLYHKTDSHWNDYGAFLGYSETIKMIGKDFDIAPIPRSDYRMTTTLFKGDLMPILNKNSDEESLVLKKIKPSKVDTLSAVYTFRHFTNPTNNLKLIMHCDSFADAWIPFFNESFGETVYVRNYIIDNSLIEKIQPDIVIFEIVERNLIDLLNN